MLFTHDEKIQLFNRLPSLELSYEPKLHKKVYAESYYIIPKGPKALVWYTYWKDQNVCLMITLNERGNYSDIKLFPAVFSVALSIGTLIYGTLFTFNKQTHFTCEHLYYYKGVDVHTLTLLAKMSLLLEMFETRQVEQVVYTSASLIVGLPVITDTYEKALDILEGLPYRTYGIGAYGSGAYGSGAYGSGAYGSGTYKSSAPPKSAAIIPRQSLPGCAPPARDCISQGFQSSQGSHSRIGTSSNDLSTHVSLNPMPINTSKNLNRSLPLPRGAQPLQGGVRGALAPRIMKVKADLNADIYHLYALDDTLIGTATIPSYKCSVMMNALFRHIKENANLDLLEESDDDEEFENNQNDKFVDLDKTILMECVYQKKFQKWQPMKVVK